MTANNADSACSFAGSNRVNLGQPRNLTSGKGKKSDNDDDYRNNDNGDSDDDIIGNSYRSQGGTPFKRSTSTLPNPFRFMGSNEISSSLIFSSLPNNFGSLLLRSAAIATITLYVLNQKHMLPMPIGKVVSKALFWPTIPITISRRIGKWSTVVDNAVVMGGAPFGWCGYPERLSKRFNVRGVINMCDEYRGPIYSYKRLGIEHLRLPTVDHFEPSVEDLKKAVSFIQKHEHQGGRVYVHCRAGHGRSAAAVYAWLLYKEPLADPVELNEKLCAMRDVRKSLWKQPNINIFREWLQNGGMMSDSEESDEDDDRSYPRGRKFANNRSRTSEVGGSDSDDSDNNVSFAKLGKVFDDENTVDSSDDDDVHFDSDYDLDNSDNGKDYEMWKSYNRGRQ
ncbi:hypothetical protein ACHAWU_004117 [Discostella pseudostelligera]|uniref:Protein-tyrosine-phosphatase n=1 Tax=Discostella pseudostelligera TaxID=259834 RepID=A0ABD3MJP6_9STRA